MAWDLGVWTPTAHVGRRRVGTGAWGRWSTAGGSSLEGEIMYLYRGVGHARGLSDARSRNWDAGIEPRVQHRFPPVRGIPTTIWFAEDVRHLQDARVRRVIGVSTSSACIRR